MKPITYKPGQVRLFLVILYAVLLVVLLRSAHGVKNAVLPLSILSGVCLFFILLPKLFFPLFRMILIGSSYVGNLIFAVLTIIVFYLVLTPLSLVMRLLGKRFLHSRFQPRTAGASYYEEPEAATDVSRQY